MCVCVSELVLACVLFLCVRARARLCVSVSACMYACVCSCVSLCDSAPVTQGSVGERERERGRGREGGRLCTARERAMRSVPVAAHHAPC